MQTQQTFGMRGTPQTMEQNHTNTPGGHASKLHSLTALNAGDHLEL